MIKSGDSVLEPACGPAELAGYLPRGVSYFGFDINEEFLKYAGKKGRHVAVGNVLDSKNFKKSDYVIAVDILHHLPPETHEKFLTYCSESARKAFILCEPTDEEEPSSILFPIKKFIVEWFEQDGENKISVHSGFDSKEYDEKIKRGFGVIGDSVKREVKKMGADTIVTFYKTSDY
jgi:cyclopropane fatty-acyl-phospholipid synthase-like methyltransferase